MVENSIFLSEFLALKVTVETIQFLQFKLRSFGVPIMNEEAAYVYCNNQGVVKNTPKVESKIDKNHSAVAYHFVRYAVAKGMITIA